MTLDCFFFKKQIFQTYTCFFQDCSLLILLFFLQFAITIWISLIKLKAKRKRELCSIRAWWFKILIKKMQAVKCYWPRFSGAIKKRHNQNKIKKFMHSCCSHFCSSVAVCAPVIVYYGGVGKNNKFSKMNVVYLSCWDVILSIENLTQEG